MKTVTSLKEWRIKKDVQFLGSVFYPNFPDIKRLYKYRAVLIELYRTVSLNKFSNEKKIILMQVIRIVLLTCGVVADTTTGNSEVA